MFNKIPLFFVILDKKHFKKQGKNNSCTVKIHPSISLLDDNIQKQIKEYIENAIDLVRDNINIDDI